MAVEIRPEATEPERAVLLHVLALLEDTPPVPGDAWRRAALGGDEDYAAPTAPAEQRGRRPGVVEPRDPR